MEQDDLLKNMRERAEKCRRLAKSIDPRTAQILEQMADEVEADIERFLGKSN